MSISNYYRDKVEKDFNDNKKWGLPRDYERKSLVRTGMDEDLALFALNLEVEENELMREYKKEKAVQLVREVQSGAVKYSVKFTKRWSEPQPVVSLTPTMLMFVVSHMSRELQAEEIYNPGYFKRFCQEYYENETNNRYKKVVTPADWDNAVDCARDWLVDNYNPIQER